MDEDEILFGLKALPGWAYSNGKLWKSFPFDTYIEAVDFANHVAGIAERMQQHPDILRTYNRVTLTTSTHDAGGVTEKDFKLARAIEEL